jgi:hypothetical protein
MQWSEDARLSAWQRAAPAGWPFDDATMFRHDALGRLMYWHDYGDRTSGLGWQIHRVTLNNGSSDSLAGDRMEMLALNWRTIAQPDKTAAEPLISNFISRHEKQFPRVCELLKEEPAPESTHLIELDQVIAPLMRELNEN